VRTHFLTERTQEEPLMSDHTASAIASTTITAVDRHGVRDLVEAGAATVVEALPAPYFEDAHLPGARNLPHDSDEATIAALLPDHDATVVVYCSNLACQNSTILSRRLAQLGYTDVREYEAGKEDWITAGLPVESTGVSAS
jgi:rhodanese-related sulfurtransferase